MADVARRTIVLGGFAMTLGAMATGAAAQEKLAWDFSFPALEGGSIKLADFRGRVLLVVNTASFCGFTYQYEGLQKLHSARHARGLTVIGVPSGDFGQESASNAEVKKFCDTNFGIDFPMSEIQKVRGDNAHPFYRWVRDVRSWEPSWNFGKVLIGRDGRIAGAFGSSDEPAGLRVGSAIDTALNAQA